MNFSDEWKEKVRLVFPETGNDWLLELDEKLQYIINKYSLSDVERCPVETVNLVLYAKHKDWGDVVLKLGAPDPDIQHEMDVLKACNGKGMCRFLDGSKEGYYFLMERVLPGDMLYDYQDEEVIFDDGLEVIVNSQCQYLGGSYPTYELWLDNNKKKLTKVNRYSDYQKKVSELAYKYLDDVNKEPFEQCLLHGDLHHQNILKGENDYVIIDPKGVIGPAFLESARFMDNHIERLGGDRQENYRRMVKKFAHAYHVEEVWVWKGLFMLEGLSELWNMESLSTEFSTKRQSDLDFFENEIKSLESIK